MRASAAALLSSAALWISCVCDVANAADAGDPLKSGFDNPPQSARPRVWWHWMNGNITKEGITLDLEWMQRAGLGGFQVFDAAFETPQVVDKRLVYMTPEWKDAFQYASALGHRLGLEEAIAGSPGWSESGGPWVPAAQGMKKYVWSATLVRGGKPFSGRLPRPPTNTGAFQGLPINDPAQTKPTTRPVPQFYADSVVIAYRRPLDDLDLNSLHPKMTASGGAPDYTMLTDGDLGKATKVPIPKVPGADSWIQYEFARPETVRAVTLVTREPGAFIQALRGEGVLDKVLEASDDGIHFREVARLHTGDTFSPMSPEYTFSFGAATAKYFRVAFKRTSPASLPLLIAGVDPSTFGIQMPAPPTDYEICELVLHRGSRVNRWEEKAGFVADADLYPLATQPVEPAQALATKDVLDLTSKMQSDGTLHWTPPPGNWVVLRFGYSLLGIVNHPATEEATGLEVDKLNDKFVKQYFNAYLETYEHTVGTDGMGRGGIDYVVNDSWEAGSQNWTDDMIVQFKKRRGYDPLPWMAVLTGRIVESAESSDKFLWDFRKTIADLIADEHYGELEKILHERGMGHYGESHEVGRAFIGDGMEVKKFNEVPMGAMWTQPQDVNAVQYGFNADDRESASVAHIYGQNLAAAESMTALAAPWGWSPASLKSTADQEFLNGINRIVIHESAHQPLIGKAPGMTLGPYGQWFNRNETWAEYARPWVDYLARSSFLLQQGHFAADIVYFYGEDSNLTAIFANKEPPIPAGFGFDYINADGLIHELKVSDGRIVTASGMSYRVLGLDPYSRHMSLPVLRAIHSLVVEGAVVAGLKPIDDPSLADELSEFRQLSDELFGDGTGTHHVGKGTVYAAQDVAAALKASGVPPDFYYTTRESEGKLLFVHRRLPDGDLYFVDNRSEHAQSAQASFRITGKAPDLWRAEDGTAVSASFTIADDRTSLPLELEPWGTVFVVFRQPTTATSRTLVESKFTPLATIDGEWQIQFQLGRGAPPSLTIDKLDSWSDNADPGVRYFSGIGTYNKIIHAKSGWFAKRSQLWIDLGSVNNLAEVIVNGKSLGVVWHTPYRVNATTALKAGINHISVKVINAWVNRLIGDQQPSQSAPITFADVKPYKADSPLLDSGLLGPVRIVRSTVDDSSTEGKRHTTHW